MIKEQEAEATKQAPSPAQPAEAPSSLSLNSLSTVLYVPYRKLCPIEYPIKADWPDTSKEEKKSQEENKDIDNFSDIED